MNNLDLKKRIIALINEGIITDPEILNILEEFEITGEINLRTKMSIDNQNTIKELVKYFKNNPDTSYLDFMA
ncbi:MAG: hypothetical protein LBN93_00320 [Candidatus Symbiothrix sp.]|jgi:hypothetical protein|nr:hypothetical protein [Candidatus Symbiothrix sp.]